MRELRRILGLIIEGNVLGGDPDADLVLVRIGAVATEVDDLVWVVDSFPPDDPFDHHELVFAPHGTTASPSWIAARIVAMVVSVLPSSGSTRYGEEFSAELHELAAQHRSQGIQLTYAVRIGSQIWSLRRALRAAAAGRQVR